MKVYSYRGLDKNGKTIRWIADKDSKHAIKTWKNDERVVKITEDDKEIWKRK